MRNALFTNGLWVEKIIFFKALPGDIVGSYAAYGDIFFSILRISQNYARQLLEVMVEMQRPASENTYLPVHELDEDGDVDGEG
ncbi:hypothetical protein [Rhizobium sp. CNPSo 3490]|uniref:hypothetical protein n=1 Tax=Rhizobium sp. CNPSo 3490 TaxID=3021407 RepID=UPI00254A3384|nr:hypothetical protein [Rhizobium sp. CNPSo 3490]MDK4733008.1 hypothetical protein [Rhizobium sp. CNPSo 3490]